MTSPKKCILCSNSSVFHPLKFTKTYKKMGKRDYFRCPECDLIFVPEEFHLSSIDEEARYLLHNNTLSNEGYVNMFMEKIKLIRQYCPGIMSVLDYGCGHEPVLTELLQRRDMIVTSMTFISIPGFLYVHMTSSSLQRFSSISGISGMN